MPCVFPILSLKALSLARSGSSAYAARVEAFSYTAGAIIVCAVLGALLLVLRAAGGEIGWAFQLQNPYVILSLTALKIGRAHVLTPSTNSHLVCLPFSNKKIVRVHQLNTTTN